MRQDRLCRRYNNFLTVTAHTACKMCVSYGKFKVKIDVCTTTTFVSWPAQPNRPGTTTDQLAPSIEVHARVCLHADVHTLA